MSGDVQRPIIAANWKMHLTAREGAHYVEALLPLTDGLDGVEIVLAPPATALDRVGQALAGSAVQLAGQDLHAEDEGAFTGEIAARMLADLGCRYALVGHSERRTLYGETSELVARKAGAALRSGLRPIVCIGETLEQREKEETEEVVCEQLAVSLEHVPDERPGDLVVAYEPVWAIGTGRTATPSEAQAVHELIHERLADRFGQAGRRVPVLYGGSVKPANTAALMEQRDIDGALVGGASLDPASFATIVRCAAS